MYPSLFWIIFYWVMYVRIGVRGSNRGIVIGTRMTRFQDRDKANVCTFASELINSQSLSALMRLHLKIENTLSALMRLNLKIAKKSGCLHLNVWKKTDFRQMLLDFNKKLVCSVHSPFSPSFPVEFEAFYQNKFGLAYCGVSFESSWWALFRDSAKTHADWVWHSS